MESRHRRSSAACDGERCPILPSASMHARPRTPTVPAPLPPRNRAYGRHAYPARLPYRLLTVIAGLRPAARVFFWRRRTARSAWAAASGRERHPCRHCGRRSSLRGHPCPRLGISSRSSLNAALFLAYRPLRPGSYTSPGTAASVRRFLRLHPPPQARRKQPYTPPPRKGCFFPEGKNNPRKRRPQKRA